MRAAHTTPRQQRHHRGLSSTVGLLANVGIIILLGSVVILGLLNPLAGLAALTLVVVFVAALGWCIAEHGERHQNPDEPPLVDVDYQRGKGGEGDG